MWYAKYDNGDVTSEFPNRKELLDYLDEYYDGCGMIDIFKGDRYMGRINL